MRSGARLDAIIEQSSQRAWPYRRARRKDLLEVVEHKEHLSALKVIDEPRPAAAPSRSLDAQGMRDRRRDRAPDR